MCFLFGKQNCIIPKLNSDWLIPIKVHPSFKKNRMRFYSIKVLKSFWSKFYLTVVTVKNPSKTLTKNTCRTWQWALSFCELFFLPNLQLNIGKKYLKTAIIIDESLILAIVSRNYSTKPSYIFQLKRELKVWKYIFNLFHFEVLIQNSNPKFRSLSLFVLTFHEYKARFVFGSRLDYKLSLFIFFLFCVKLFCVLFMCYN
jgi:hypothetical protein